MNLNPDQFGNGDDEDENPNVDFSLDDVAAQIQRAGHPAYVLQTGGGTATLYAGPQRGTDDSDLPVHPVTIGPGVFTSGGYVGLPPDQRYEHRGPVASTEEAGIVYEDGDGDSVPWGHPDPVGWLSQQAVEHLGGSGKKGS